MAADLRVIAAALLLAGCASRAPVSVPVAVPEPIEVKVPVPVPCVRAEQLPRAPELESDAELLKLSDYELVLRIEIHRRELRAYVQQVRALLTACTAG